VITELRYQLQIFNRWLFPAHAKLLLEWLLMAFIHRYKFLVWVWNIWFATGLPLFLFFNNRSVNRFTASQSITRFTCTKLGATVVLSRGFQVNFGERLTCCWETLRAHHSWAHDWLIMCLLGGDMRVLRLLVRLETQRNRVELLLKELLLEVHLGKWLLLNLSATN
jgi:hypothetical protein